MGMPARKLEFEEVTVEERLARLESNGEHIQSDVSEIKGDIRRLDAKVDALKDSIAAKFDAVNASIAALAVSNEKSVSKLIIWAVGLIATLVTAHSFHWL
jgi:predicted  nucleic acid-binding Zn-ribbon protein